MLEIVTLSNGLRIALDKMSSVRSVSMGFWIQNGSRNEFSQNNGISHFIEHMLFKGTSNRDAKQIADEMDAIGGQLNAFTAKEYTCYYTRVLDNHFDNALDILSDMLFNSNFDDAEIEKERNVILEEISMYEDTPEDLVHDIMQSAVWKNDSLGLPILGTRQSIAAFNHKRFVDYYHKNYCPENTVISIAGNIDIDTIVKKVERYFKYFQRENNYIFSSDNPIYTPSIITKEKDIEQLHLCMSFPGLPIGSDNAYVFAVLNTLFGGGMSSRLFQSIREDKGLVYSIYSYGASYKNTGLVSIYAALNQTQAKDAIQYIVQETAAMCNVQVSAKQLSNTKEQLKSNYLLSLESSSNIMNNNGKTQLMLGKTLSANEIIAKVDEVTAEKIQALSQTIFNLDNISLSAVGKLNGMSFEELLRFGN